MSRRRDGYDEAFGVSRIRWHRGAPRSDTFGLVLVEVWTPDLVIADYATPANKPQVRVRSEVQVWRRTSASGWQRLSHGEPVSVDPARIDVRRWASLPYRWWTGTITLDKWDANA